MNLNDDLKSMQCSEMQVNKWIETKKKDIAIVYDTTHKDHIYIAGVSESQYLNEKLNI